MYKKHLKINNEISKSKAEQRVHAAYEEWLVTKSKIKLTAQKHKTDPSKLTKYILLQGHRLTTINPNVFENIDSEDKAYWLGFLFADGFVDEKRNMLEISLQLKDENHLRKFYNFLECDRKVKKDSFRCRVSAGNPKLIHDLIKWGCKGKKSLVLSFPSLSKNMIRHFVRGYFDGDGSITKGLKTDLFYSSAQLCSGSKSFLISLLSQFNELTGSNCKQKGYNPKNTNTYIVVLKNNLCIKFLQWLYKDSTISLDRKYDRYIYSIAVQGRNILDY